MKNPIEINEIDPSDLLKMVDENPHLSIIDVREDWERELECIQPSLHIPLGNFHQETPPQSLPVLWMKRLSFIAKRACEVWMHVKSYPIWVTPN